MLHPQHSENLELPIGQGEWILIVDDEASVLEVTKILLEAHNYQVLTASDGNEAIALYTQHQEQISLVLTDMMMPSLDGSSTIRSLEQINPQIKIIAVSGLASNRQIAETAGTSVKKFLSKPYKIDELLKTLYEIIHT